VGSVYASYLHLHWGNLPHFPKKFIQGSLE
jgi:cobyrinic acid a,c-diamide synthase